MTGEMAWTGAWAAAMHRPSDGAEGSNRSEKGFDGGLTLRQVVRLGAGGSRIRIRLSNAFGPTPLRLRAATVSLAGNGATVVLGSTRSLRFGDENVVPAGETATSAPVDLRVEPLDRLAVTLSFEEDTGPATFHNLAGATSYLAAGDPCVADAFRDAGNCRYYLTGVEVEDGPPVVVTLGDSITDGALSTPDADRRYPDLLVERLVRAGRPMGVLNAGIGGNRLLHDSVCFGEKATTRFRRDVIDQPGVRTAIVLLGINDIGFGVLDHSPCTVPNPEVTAEELIEGHRKLVEVARAHGVRIIGGTITPFGGSGFDTDRGEEVRRRVNHWIRTGGEYDAVADFDRVLADPAEPRRLRPEFDAGENGGHLHPNDAGYQAMADAIDLDAL